MEAIVIFLACIVIAAIGLWYGMTFLNADFNNNSYDHQDAQWNGYNARQPNKNFNSFMKRVKMNSSKMKYSR